MKRLPLFLLILAVTIIVIVFTITTSRQKSSARALREFKAKLVERGEVLSWSELGYPLKESTNDCVPKLVQAVGEINGRGFSPGAIRLMDVSSPTNIQPCWVKPELLLRDNKDSALTWDEFGDVIIRVEIPLAKIRAALANPPKHWITNPTNFSQQPKSSFKQQRDAAQWLSAQIIYGLHEQDLGRVHENLLALQQMVHLHEEDPTLVSAMIRVAIAGLALSDTWEAMQSDGWKEKKLADIQNGWERINLFDGLERGLLGDRLFGNFLFTQFRSENSNSDRQSMFGMVGYPNRTTKGFRYYFESFVVFPFWRMHMDEDELLALRNQQNCLDAARSLKLGSDWPTIRKALQANSNELAKALSGPLDKARHLMSAITIPNSGRYTLTAARTETLRRLAIVAIAIKRYELQNAHPPPSLEALIPNFLAAVPMDIMSGKPLCYRRDSQSGYVLYSVGDDGLDDGGAVTRISNAKSGANGNEEIWSFKDYIWPTVTSTHR